MAIAEGFIKRDPILLPSDVILLVHVTIHDIAPARGLLYLLSFLHYDTMKLVASCWWWWWLYPCLRGFWENVPPFIPRPCFFLLSFFKVEMSWHTLNSIL